MHKFTTGFLAGSLIAAVGVGYCMSDANTRKKIMKNGKKMASKAENLMEDVKGDIW